MFIDDLAKLSRLAHDPHADLPTASTAHDYDDPRTGLLDSTRYGLDPTLEGTVRDAFTQQWRSTIGAAERYRPDHVGLPKRWRTR